MDPQSNMEADDRAWPLPGGRRPVHNEQVAHRHRDPQFLSDLPGAGVMWVLALVDIAAGEGPVVAVRRFDEQHVAGRVGNEGRGGGVEGSQVGIPRGGLRPGHLSDASGRVRARSRQAAAGMVARLCRASLTWGDAC